MKHVFLVDGSGFIFRAFHALPPMSRPDGTPVNAVYGFTQMLMKLIAETDADHIAVIFDTARKSFRNDFYPEYKAHRPPPPDELIPQFELIREAVRAFNLPSVEMDGFEADDLIATYTRQAREAGAKVTIVSSDKDLMQLVHDGEVVLFDAMKNKEIRAEDVVAKFGVGPDKVVDVQALAGDSTDNVPGVPGIGVKTAAQLIEQYGDVDTLLAHAEEIKQPKRRQNLIDHAEAARISRRLVLLRSDCEVTEALDTFTVKKPDVETLTAFLKDNGFNSILARVREKLAADGEDLPEPVRDPAAEAATAPDDIHYDSVLTLDALDAWIEEATRTGVVAIDTETDALDAHGGNLVGLSLSTAPGRACYVPLRHVDPEAVPAGQAQGSLDLGGDAAAAEAGSALRPDQIGVAEALKRLGPLLENPGVLKVGHNIKYDLHVLEREMAAHGLPVRVMPVDDTMVMSYVLDGTTTGHGMDELARRHLDHTCTTFTELCGKGKNQITFDKVPVDKATHYAAEDADITLRLHRLFRERLFAERMTGVYESLDRPQVRILADMEAAGIKVDSVELRRLSDDLGSRMRELEVKIHALAGEEFNPGSPKQLGEILFGKMSLPGGKKSKTGAYSTSADILEQLAAQGHDLPARVLDWRQVQKLKSTYADSLVNQIRARTGRVHTNYSQTATSTGRLSSQEPNLQNIPIRTEEGRKIRRAFVAEQGCKLISADYSQIELRLVAHVADIAALKEAFREGQDIHAITASQVFGVPVEGMDPMIRRRAKAINFGIIYGISPFGLAAQLGIDRGEAKAYIDAYFDRFPEIRAYMDETKAFAKTHGFVRTPFGRKCWTPGISDRNPNMRGFAERAAINAPIQGGAADIIKRAMIRVPAALTDAGLETKMLLQVHDELVFEAPEAEAERAVAVIKAVMEGAAELSVPLEVEAGIADTWAEAH
ncbi:DNA polymerase I [Caenispirillum salinarum AK4]|uniref:DNA polymerase I n=1 Tax=Caenispirillum salinarum AK4 TaxID=1238182 RepID=K9GP06_9PROT|nr:DNA polymerase I [Caenispirillum salinarum]EKV26882.1 DNA polymerase I [Caenispirillum salinarum AK4]